MQAIRTYDREYSRLSLCCLTPEQRARTCDYWYVVQDYHSPHTAFRTRAALVSWLNRLGLQLTAELPPEREHAYIPIKGRYKRASHMATGSFALVQGLLCRVLDNGSYTAGVISHDSDGIRTVHHLNCNAERPEFNYNETREMCDRGEAVL